VQPYEFSCKSTKLFLDDSLVSIRSGTKSVCLRYYSTSARFGVW
jgi:hypothetical protein